MRRSRLPDKITPVGFLETMFQADGIELRDIEQMMEVISTFVSVWPWEDLPIDLIFFYLWFIKNI